MRSSRILLALVTSAAAAHAAPQRDPAAAEALFQEGRRLMDAGDFAASCPKFAESQRLDPGAGTVINLAACLEKFGKLASAWEKWREAHQALDASDPRAAEVLRRIREIEPRVPRLEIVLGPEAPLEVQVERGGVTLGRAALSTPLPIDPGMHEVRVVADGYEGRTFEVTAVEGETARVVVDAGAPVVEAPEPSKPAPAAEAPRVVLVSRAARPAEPPGPPTFGWIVLGVGAAAVIGGSVTGVVAISKKGTMTDDCDRIGGKLRCGPEGLDAAESGPTFATLSTVLFAVGAAGVAAGAYLVLSHDDGTAVTLGPALHSHGASFGVGRTF